MIEYTLEEPVTKTKNEIIKDIIDDKLGINTWHCVCMAILFAGAALAASVGISESNYGADTMAIFAVMGFIISFLCHRSNEKIILNCIDKLQGD